MSISTFKIIKDEVSELLRRAQDKLQDMTDINRYITEVLMSSITENFLQEGRYSRKGSIKGGSKKWKDLSPVTKAAREKIKKYPGAILRVSGDLFSSIHPEYSAHFAAVGTNLPYAKTMNFGAKKGEFGKKLVEVKAHKKVINGHEVWVKAHKKMQELPWGNIPARAFMVIQEEDLDEIGMHILDELAADSV